MTWTIVGLLLLLGAVVMHAGLRGKRINDHPICRKCKFDLIGVYPPESTGDGGTGVSSVQTNEGHPRCPECGRDLSRKRAVRNGARRKRPVVITGGALLLLLAIGVSAAWGWGRANSFNWNTVKPVWLLRMEAEGANDGAADAALSELIARASQGNLSASAHRALAQRAMEIQSDFDRSWRPLWGNLIEIAHQSKVISDDDFALSLQRSTQMWTFIDPSTVPSDFSFALNRPPDRPNPQKPLYEGERQYLVFSFGMRGAASTDLFMRPVLETFTVDGKEVNAGIGMHQQMGMTGASGFNNVSITMFEPMPAGVHEAVSTWRIHVFKDLVVHRGKWGSGTVAIDSKTGEPLELSLPFRKREHTPVVDFPITISFQFTVEPQREPRTVQLVRDPELKALVEESISIQFKEVRREGEYIHFLMERSVKPLPVAIAFDVFIRDGDQEWPSAPLHMALDGELRMRSMRILTKPEEFGVASDHVDLILRPNPTSVELTEGFDAIWGEEIILRGVPIEWITELEESWKVKEQ